MNSFGFLSIDMYSRGGILPVLFVTANATLHFGNQNRNEGWTAWVRKKLLISYIHLNHTSYMFLPTQHLLKHLMKWQSCDKVL